MPFVKIWIHAVWATKSRHKILTAEIRQKVFHHIHQNALDKGIMMEIVGGADDHVHCLFRLRNDQTISKVMQLIKGESSFWINKQHLTISKFEWQDEYFAVSVAESQLSIIKKYIQNQEQHHRKKTFQQEHEDFIEKYDFRTL